MGAPKGDRRRSDRVENASRSAGGSRRTRRPAGVSRAGFQLSSLLLEAIGKPFSRGNGGAIAIPAVRVRGVSEWKAADGFDGPRALLRDRIIALGGGTRVHAAGP